MIDGQVDFATYSTVPLAIDRFFGSNLLPL